LGKRILLFVITNALVLASVSLVMMLFGVENQIGETNVTSLIVLSVTVGFSGAFVSLLLSRIVAKWMLKVKLLDESRATTASDRFILDQIRELSDKAGLLHMPEVGIYPATEINAFATGPTKKRSLVALSSGLVNTGDSDMIRGIIAHEIAHIKSGDMITMTLLQGVVNSLVVFLSRIVANIVSNFVRPEFSTIAYFITALVFNILFSILSSPLIYWFSRLREYKADELGAYLGGREIMIHALEKLALPSNTVDTNDKSIATFKISGGTSKSAIWFSTHPPLERRIQALKEKN
jgi:heat shock protein HtpX